MARRYGRCGWTPVMLAALTLGGCSAKAHAAHRVEFWTMALKPTFTDYVQSTLAEFKRVHPEIEIEWLDLPGNAIEDKLVTAVISGTAPDLVNLNPDFSGLLADKGALLDLSRMVPRGVLASYFPAALEANRVDGKLIGLPWYLSTQVAIYNRSLLEKAGLPTLPGSYRALATEAKRFKPLGVAPFLPNFGDGNRLLELFAMDGVPLLTRDGRHAGFDTPEGRESFGFWVGLYTRGILPTESLNLDNREIVDRFQSGQSVVLPAGPQFLKHVRDNSPALYRQVAVAPQIAGKSGQVGVGVMNLVVPTLSEHAEDALTLATFITDAKHQLAFCKLAGILPSARSAAADPYFTTLGASSSVEDQARLIAARQLTRSVLLVPPMPHQDDLKKSLNAALQRAALGEAAPNVALRQAAADWDRILASP